MGSQYEGATLLLRPPDAMYAVMGGGSEGAGPRVAETLDPVGQL